MTVKSYSPFLHVKCQQLTLSSDSAIPVGRESGNQTWLMTYLSKPVSKAMTQGKGKAEGLGILAIDLPLKPLLLLLAW